MSPKHEFAFYLSHLSALVYATHHDVGLTISDTTLVTRIGSVLRLKVGETIIIFDNTMYVRCVIRDMQKKILQVEIVEKKMHAALKPDIICLLPLLKRDDLELALYAAVELGATTVRLVTTQKVQRTWGGDKEMGRLRRVMIAAAEQSKNFMIPEVHEPVALAEALQCTRSIASKIFFDAEGDQLMHQQFLTQRLGAVLMIVGPEGDLTTEEKELLRQSKFVFCSLTPTVLRSVTAFGLGLGLLRSLLK